MCTTWLVLAGRDGSRRIYRQEYVVDIFVTPEGNIVVCARGAITNDTYHCVFPGTEPNKANLDAFICGVNGNA